MGSSSSKPRKAKEKKGSRDTPMEERASFKGSAQRNYNATEDQPYHVVPDDPESPKPCCTKEEIADNFGAGNTGTAMVAQSLLGGLLIYPYLKPKLPVGANLALSSLTAAGTFAGKFGLLRFFNTNAFIGLAKYTELKNLRTLLPDHWTVYGTVRNLISIIPSAVFASLTKISFAGCAEILNTFDNHHTRRAAEVLQNYWFQAPFVAASFVSNMLAFTGMIDGALAALLDALIYSSENPEFRAVREKQELILKKHLSNWHQLVNSKDWKGANEFLQQFDIDVDLENIEAANLKEILEKINNPQLEEEEKAQIKNQFRQKLAANITSNLASGIQKESTAEFVITHGFAGLVLAATISGLYNFRYLTKKAFAPLGSKASGSAVQDADFSTMSFMAFLSVYRQTADLVRKIFRTESELNLLSLPQKIKNFTLAFLACAFGGTPNTFQSIYAHENGFMSADAFTASFLIEMYAFIALLAQRIIKKMIEKDPRIAVLLAIDNKLKEATTLKDIDPEKLAELQDTIQQKINASRAKIQSTTATSGTEEEKQKASAPRPSAAPTTANMAKQQTNVPDSDDIRDPENPPLISLPFPERYRPWAQKVISVGTSAHSFFSQAASRCYNACPNIRVRPELVIR